jgi:Pyridoxamine 5'-phosphate oxidase
VAEPRSFDERRHDSLTILGARGADAWVATSSADGAAHLVPLSIGWTGDDIVLVTEQRSLTTRNLSERGKARVALGGTRDVVMIDAEVVGELALADGRPLLDTFAEQSGWDPRSAADADAYRVVVLRPVRVQAWREANEIAGRTLMRDGAWLDDARPPRAAGPAQRSPVTGQSSRGGPHAST